MTGAADSFATLTFTYNADGELATDVTSGPGFRPAEGQPHLQVMTSLATRRVSAIASRARASRPIRSTTPRR